MFLPKICINKTTGKELSDDYFNSSEWTESVVTLSFFEVILETTVLRDKLFTINSVGKNISSRERTEITTYAFISKKAVSGFIYF